MPIKPRISLCLWFDSQAEDAARFYTSLFPNSAIKSISRYSEVGYDIHGRLAGSVMTVEFVLEGQKIVALNGGPLFQINPAMSLMVNCDTQQEIDYYWERLTVDADPVTQQCGWLTDRFGLTWQIVPAQLEQLLADSDSPGAQRTMAALLQMKKLDIAALQAAYAG